MGQTITFAHSFVLMMCFRYRELIGRASKSVKLAGSYFTAEEYLSLPRPITFAINTFLKDDASVRSSIITIRGFQLGGMIFMDINMTSSRWWSWGKEEIGVP